MFGDCESLLYPHAACIPSKVNVNLFILLNNEKLNIIVQINSQDSMYYTEKIEKMIIINTFSKSLKNKFVILKMASILTVILLISALITISITNKTGDDTGNENK